MPNLLFYINTGAKNKEGKVPVMGKIIHRKKRHYKTIAWIKETDWNKSKKKVKKNHQNAPYNRSNEINATLNDLQKLMNGFNDYCKLNKYPFTENAIKQILDGINPISGRRSANQPEINLNQAFGEWIQHSKENHELNTFKVRNTVYNFYNDFQLDTKTDITFRNIDMILFDQLKQYAIKKKEYSNNTFSKTIKIFKTFLKWCKSREYFTGEIPKDFMAAERDITPIVLTFDEFKTLYEYNFKIDKHKKVRDIFCFGCATGLRYSDLNQLRWENIQSDNIVVTLKKVKEIVQIPLNKYSREILERYQKHPVYVLPRMSNQRLNDYIKEICKEAEINAPVIIDTYKGNKFTQATKPKHEVVTAHTARKTFTTLSYYLGMRAETIQAITGIKNERTLRKYLKIVDEMKQAEMQKAWG